MNSLDDQRIEALWTQKMIREYKLYGLTRGSENRSCTNSLDDQRIEAV